MAKISRAAMCFTLSALLFLGFIIDTIMDYNKYNSTLNSAPFSLWIIMNILTFVVPSIIAFIIGLVIQKKKTD